MNSFRTFLNSFHDPTRIGKVFVIDTLAIGALFVLWYIFLQILTKLAYNMSGGKTIEDIKAQILLGSPEIQQAFLSSIKTFVLVSIIGTIVAIFLTLLIFSYSRRLLWKELVDANLPRKVWKWLSLIVILFFFSLVLLTIFILLKYLLTLSFATQSTTFAVLNVLFNFSFLVLFLFLGNIIFYSFTTTQKIWLSIGSAFHLIKVKWSQLWRAFLLILGTGIIISFLTSLLTRIPSFQKPWIISTITLLLFLLYLAWMRIYLVKTLHEQSV